MTPLGTYLASLYPKSNYSEPKNQFNYVYSALEPENREEMKLRFDWNVNNNTKAFVRIARDPADTVRAARRLVGAVGRGAADVPTCRRKSVDPTAGTSSRC